jgi:hypothetical protein
MRHPAGWTSMQSRWWRIRSFPWSAPASLDRGSRSAIRPGPPWRRPRSQRASPMTPGTTARWTIFLPAASGTRRSGRGALWWCGAGRIPTCSPWAQVAATIPPRIRGRRSRWAAHRPPLGPHRRLDLEPHGGVGGQNGVCTWHGGAHDPLLDAWTATSTTGAPTGRSSHAAVWTGVRMVVWGGHDGSSYPGTGGRYDPGTTPGWDVCDWHADGSRANHTAVWTGGRMIVWGGYDGPTRLPADATIRLWTHGLRPRRPRPRAAASDTRRSGPGAG